jgi:hypothetical protein
MTRATTAITLLLLGSPLLMAWYLASHRDDDQDPQRQGAGGHGTSGHFYGGRGIYYAGSGSTSGRGSTSVGSTARGGFGSTGAHAAAGG